MNILYLKFLKKYKQFEEGTTLNFSSDNEQFETSVFSVVTGKNGSGKTQATSVIAQTFHNIERYHDRIGFNIELTYRIRVGENFETVTLQASNRKVHMSVKGRFEKKRILDRQYLYRASKSKVDRLESKKSVIAWQEAKDYLPLSVVISIFSMHGEWPRPRPNNYQGFELVNTYLTSSVYGQNHYDLPSVTKGIGRFLEFYYSQPEVLKPLLKLLDIEFNQRVKIKEWHLTNKRWVNVSESLYRKYVDGSQVNELYLNDLEFIRFGHKITLENMSSGEKMLLIRILSILSDIEQDSLVFLEEPELHLDPIWSRQLISIFQTLFAHYKSHFIITTHDPFLINSIPPQNLTFLENGKVKELDFNPYLMESEVLFQKMYPDKLRFNQVEQNVLNAISAMEDKGELEKYISNLGDSVFRLIGLHKLKTLK